MSSQIFDIDTVGYNDGVLGDFFDFYVNNTFYLLAPDYYKSFYSIYLNRCLSVYDGWVNKFHNKKSGLVPQRMLQSIANGLNNMLFAHGIDFEGEEEDYYYAVKWAKKTKLYKALKKGHKFAIAGGTSLLKINRSNSELFVTAHRIDTFFVDVDAVGNITSAKIYFDMLHNTNASTNVEHHYGICEERYFNEKGIPCVKCSIYTGGGNLQTETQARPISQKVESVSWESLPREVKRQIKEYYPSIMIGKEEYLPFAKNLGCFLMKFTDDIPQVPNTQFGQPIGDILFTENFQYDQMKWFEKNEVDLARARALIPESYWNKDDPNADSRAMDERFFQKVSGNGTDEDKITPVQFLLRGNDMRTVKENIYKDISFKIGVSASSIASFLNEGAGARTATEIVSERTKTDTWIKGQINLNAPEINAMLETVMRYYGYNPVEIILKAEDQSPFLEKLKTNSDVLSAGNMSPRMFVRNVYSNLTESQQQEEIRYLNYTLALKSQPMVVQQPQPQNQNPTPNPNKDDGDKEDKDNTAENPQDK